MAKKGSIVVMPLRDDKLYKNKSVGDYIRNTGIGNAIIVGDVFHAELGVPVSVFLMVTTTVNDTEARKATEGWWTTKKGLKFAVWLPLNDMKEMTVSGLEKYINQGAMLAHLVELAGLDAPFKGAMKRMCEQDPSYIDSFNALGNNWGDKIVA